MTKQKHNQSIDINESTEIKKKYVEKFGKAPVEIGMFWNERERYNQNLLDAIESGKDYSEYEMLSEEDKKHFDEGNLLF